MSRDDQRRRTSSPAEHAPEPELELTGDGPVYRGPVLQLYRDRLIRELHQEPVGRVGQFTSVVTPTWSGATTSRERGPHLTSFILAGSFDVNFFGVGGDV